MQVSTILREFTGMTTISQDTFSLAVANDAPNGATIQQT